MRTTTNIKAAKPKQQNEHCNKKKASEKLSVPQGSNERLMAISILLVVIRIQQTIGKQVVIIVIYLMEF